MALVPFRLSSLFHPFPSLLDPSDVLRIWNHDPAFSSFASDAQAIANTRVDWKETEEAHSFYVDLPGLKKEDVKVEIEDQRTLRISGERQKEEVQENDNWHVVERSSGKFMRRFRLPHDVDVEAVNAKFENGVLKVCVPKIKGKGDEVMKSIDVEGEHTQIESAHKKE